MKSFTGVLLLWGTFWIVVLADEKCNEVMKADNVTDSFADSIGSTDLVVCYDITPIICGEKYYAPSLLEKRPTVYFEKSCPYATIVFFGRSPDSETVTALWIVYNVEAKDLKNGFTGQSGDEKVIYTEPKTGEGISDHFYFIYCQEDYLSSFSCCTSDNFKPREFAKNNSLKEVIAAIRLKVTATGQVMDTDVKKDDKDGVCKRN